MQSEIFCHSEISPHSTNGRGLLANLRVAVQSGISVRGWRTEAGCQALQGFIALEDATAVERLKLAGARLAGNTHTSEMGFGLYRDTAPKAFREGLVDIALMTDTMGEARAAAISAGVCGFKPSYGQVSRFGLVGLVPSMDCCSILGSRLKDITNVFNVIRGGDDRDPSMSDPVSPPLNASSKRTVEHVTAGVFTQCLQNLSVTELEAFRAALSRLERTGIAVTELSFDDFELFRVAHHVIGSVEASSSCGKFDGVRYGHRAGGSKNWNTMYLKSRAESFSMPLKAYLFQGAYFQFEDYAAFEKACKIRSVLITGIQRLFDDLDILVFPTRRASTNPGSANTLETLYHAFSLTLPSNVTGQPALALPGLAPFEGGDLGLQIAGPLFGDERLLRIAEQIVQDAEGTE